MEDKIERLKEIVKNSHHIVFFGGAGVSTESGIPDFRSKDGLYNQTYAYPPETILSHTFFKKQTEAFYTFYREKMNSLHYEPNITHYTLAKLEKQGKLQAIITQNIDGLHQKAGSQKVLELHGSVLRNYCMECHKFFNAEYIFQGQGIPKCSCGGTIKPDVVLYEEGLNDQILNASIKAIQNAEVLIVAGTSLTVHPASSLLHFYKGNHLILLNRDSTPYDRIADLVIHESLGKVFECIE